MIDGFGINGSSGYLPVATVHMPTVVAAVWPMRQIANGSAVWPKACARPEAVTVVPAAVNTTVIARGPTC